VFLDDASDEEETPAGLVVLTEMDEVLFVAIDVFVLGNDSYPKCC